MTDNEIARKAWGMGCRELRFYASDNEWVAMGIVLDYGITGVGDSPREAMLDYIETAERAIEFDSMSPATSREEA